MKDIIPSLFWAYAFPEPLLLWKIRNFRFVALTKVSASWMGGIFLARKERYPKTVENWGQFLHVNNVRDENPRCRANVFDYFIIILLFIFNSQVHTRSKETNFLGHYYYYYEHTEEFLQSAFFSDSMFGASYASYWIIEVDNS